MLGFSLATQAQLRAAVPAAGAAPQASSGPAATAKSHITSVPAGAEIAIDGQFVGSTPSDISLAPGTHQVKISLGGKEWSRSLAITAGDVNINADLAAANPAPANPPAGVSQENPVGDTSSPAPGVISGPAPAASGAIEDTRIMLQAFGRSRSYVGYRIYKGEPALVFPTSIRTSAFSGSEGELYVTATQLAFNGNRDIGHPGTKLDFSSPRSEVTYAREGHKNIHLTIHGEVKDCYGGFIGALWTTETDWFKLLDLSLSDFNAAVGQFKQYAGTQPADVGGTPARARSRKR